MRWGDAIGNMLEEGIPRGGGGGGSVRQESRRGRVGGEGLTQGHIEDDGTGIGRGLERDQIVMFMLT